MSGREQSINEDEYWKKIQIQEPITAINKCEESAKQLLTVTSLLSSIYIGIISFSDVVKQPISIRSFFLLLLIPLFFLLISLFLATRVIVPRFHSEKRNIRDDYIEISLIKYRTLKWSYAFLLISMIALITVIAFYLVYTQPLPA